MTGVLEVTFDAPIGKAIEDILLIFACSLEGELDVDTLSAEATEIPE